MRPALTSTRRGRSPRAVRVDETSLHVTTWCASVDERDLVCLGQFRVRALPVSRVDVLLSLRSAASTCAGALPQLVIGRRRDSTTSDCLCCSASLPSRSPGFNYRSLAA